jgi:hypothetical protein
LVCSACSSSASAGSSTWANARTQTNKRRS